MALLIDPDKLIGFCASVLLHFALIFGGGRLFFAPAQFSIAPGAASLEVDLVAGPKPEKALPMALPENVAQDAELPQIQEVAITPSQPSEVLAAVETLEEVAEKPEVLPMEEDPTSEDAPEILAENFTREPRLPDPPSAPQIANEDLQPSKVAPPGAAGSSAPPASTYKEVAQEGGSSKVSGSGALTAAQPQYLSNPAPAYPLEARRNGWEGSVLFNVRVSAAGDPLEIEIEKSSGHALLDDVAKKTLKTWRFYPARLGNIAVESAVRIPIRFQLEELKR